ncbi:MAG: hypothetical protein NVS4B8_20320 [Herpetosiphon sp.]
MSDNGLTPPVETPTQRAEEAVDRLGTQVGQLFATSSLFLRQLAARTREEVEDIVAEAQSLRHRDGQ